MATFVLVHGSFHAAWNWHRLLPVLRRSGHQGLALDLPGHGRDRTPPHAVTLERCVDALGAAIGEVDEKVVLVAHSRNGIVIARAAGAWSVQAAAGSCLAAEAAAARHADAQAGPRSLSGVFSLDSGHSPFFAQPGALAQALIDSLEVARP